MLLPIKDLDETNLQAAMHKLNGRVGRGILHFRVKPVGRFDAALVPIGPAGEAPHRWLLAIEENLSLRDQVALYGHALGHLLLNNEQKKMGQLPELDPRPGYAHSDMLAELRMLETTRNGLDRRVLETYPLLTELLRVREEPASIIDLATSELRQKLAQSGWRGQFVEIPYVFTAGRVFLRESSPQHGRKLRVDALLRAEASLPIAIVQTIHAGRAREDVVRELIEYAHHRLALPFAYLLEDGIFHEFDWTTNDKTLPAGLPELPTREALWNRWSKALGLSDKVARDALHYPYQLSGPRPRYYQEAAINRAIIAVLQAKHQLRSPRILLTLATGTGKTRIAFELVWKLKRTRAIRNVLYLTDRDYLLSQAMDNDFAPFGDARQRILGEAKTSRDIVFATYQAMANSETRSGLYREFPRDFFDVVIVDECHRGSAEPNSNWRDILEYFESAVQIGMTATPLSKKAIQTDEYFGKSIYTYSLSTGINDGFLAPYRVRRILMGHKLENELPAQADAHSPDAPLVAWLNDDISISNAPLMEETSKTLRERTGVIARHLVTYMWQTDPLAKTIVFCVDQNHAEQMREDLGKACAEYVTRYPEYVERIVSDEGIEGKRALGRFSSPEERTPVIVTTSRLLSTGVDIPTCKNIVLARPVGSLVEFKQIIGRGSRLYEPQKTWFAIIDYAGAIKLFFDPNFDGDPELVEVESLVPQPQPQEDSLTGEGELKIIDDTSLAGIIGGPELPALKEGDAGYPPDQVPGESSSTVTTPSSQNAPSQPVSTDEGSEQEGGAVLHVQQTEDTPVVAWPSEVISEGPEPIQAPVVITEPPLLVKQTPSGRRIEVIGEYIYDLSLDGKSLRLISSYSDYTAAALKDIVKTPKDLRTRWLSREQREALRAQLAEEGVDLQALATALHLPQVDPLDILLHIAFSQSLLTRSERVERLYREHADFFKRYRPEAREILDIILKKYVDGEVEDVSDPELLKSYPLSERGKFIEVAKSFGGGPKVRLILNELQQLLYSA